MNPIDEGELSAEMIIMIALHCNVFGHQLLLSPCAAGDVVQRKIEGPTWHTSESFCGIPAMTEVWRFFHTILTSLNFYPMDSINLFRPKSVFSFSSTRPRQRKLLVCNICVERRIKQAGMKTTNSSSLDPTLPI